MIKSVPLVLVVLVLTVSACSSVSASGPNAASAAVTDLVSLTAALQAAGATVESGGSISQDFFSVEGQSLTVNGVDTQVFEYGTTAGMEAEAATVAPDGGSVGTSMVSWMDMPHFFKAGRMILIYVGSDPSILDLLGKTIGPQFAGR